MGTVPTRPLIQLEASWREALSGEFEQPYMKELRAFLASELKKGKMIFPRMSEVFNALNTTPLERVRVVILGQDPYHGPGQAHGLCFSVRKGVPLPPSLQNIFKEIESEMGVEMGQSGDLTNWAEQGVLLLNTVLTIENGKAHSHQGKGWERFTDRVIQVVNARNQPVIFVLWGNPAQKKISLITNPKHKILKSPHPSPLSAHRGFFGNGHFVMINKWLRDWGSAPIDWSPGAEMRSQAQSSVI